MSRLLFYLCFFCALNSAICQSSEKFTQLDSAIKILKANYSKDWNFTKYGSRIIATKKDSVLIATSYTEYKPGKPLHEIVHLKHKYQLFLDFYEPDLDFMNGMHKMINDSLDKMIKSFRKKNYGKGEYFLHLEAMEQFEKMKMKEPERLKHFDLKFTDNCASDWIPYEMKDVQHQPFEPPTSFQKEIAEMREKITKLLLEGGI